MMKKTEAQKQYGTLKYVFLTILNVLLVFLLTAFLLICMTLRYYVKTAAIPEAVAAVALENLKIEQEDGSEKSIAEYILEEFVQDDRVSAEDVEEVLEDGTFSEFARILTEQYNHYLADGGDFPEIDADEFVQILEENADLIYEKTGLRFLDPDKKKLKENLTNPLETLNQALERRMYKGVSGFFLRFAVSIWSEILLAVLMLLVLIWLIKIHIRGRKRVGTALKIYSVTAFQPCLIVFMIGLLMSWILELMHLPGELGTVLRGRTVTFSGIGLLICTVIFIFGMIWNLVAKKPGTEAVPEMPEPVNPESIPEPVPQFEPIRMPEASAPKVSLEKTSRKPLRLFCRYCGKELIMQDAEFCAFCHKKQ